MLQIKLTFFIFRISIYQLQRQVAIEAYVQFLLTSATAQRQVGASNRAAATFLSSSCNWPNKCRLVITSKGLLKNLTYIMRKLNLFTFIKRKPKVKLI